MIEPFVDARWLSDNLNRVRVADTRWYLDGSDGLAAYLAGHIPGAAFIDLDTVLAAPAGPIVGRHPLPKPEAFAAGMGAAGISPDDVVIAYDDLGGMVAGRLVWMLRILGRQAAVLDGGLAAWEGELETGAVSHQPIGYPSTSWPFDAIVNADEVSAHVEAGGAVVDARGGERYRGEVEPVDPRPGHIPGATNLPFASLLTEAGRLREDAVDQAVEAHLDGDAIAYCGSGVSACLNVLVAEMAGRGRPKLYVGSWSGWSSDPGRAAALGG